MDFPIELKDLPGVPLYRQLYESIVVAIQTGRLKSGQALPSSRDVCRMLGLGRNTVIRAYDELESQHYVHTEIGLGTFVSANLSKTAVTVQISQALDRPQRSLNTFNLSPYARRLTEIKTVQSLQEIPEMYYGGPPPDLLPLSQWSKLLAAQIKEKKVYAEQPYLSDALGYFPLREAIANYLSRSRSIICEADQVAIFPAQLHALNLVARLFVQPGEKVAVENPSFPGARQTFEAEGATILPVPIDDQGLSVVDLQKSQGCRLVYTVPSHIEPIGTSMSRNRRDHLLTWIIENDALVIEDDFDCEYRYSGSPIPSLYSLDKTESVIYFGTFWKLLFPLSTVGFIVAPWSLMRTIAKAKALVEPTLPMLEQYALTKFINDGYLERYIKKTRQIHTKRRQAVIFALTKQFGESIVLSKESAGLHLTARFQIDALEAAIIDCASNAQLTIWSTAPYYICEAPKNEFVIPFANLNESEIADKFALFSSLLLKLC